MPERPLSQAFTAAFGPVPILSEAPLESALRQLVDAARAAHPTLSLPDERFVAYLAARMRGAEDVLATLAALRADDLYLACACAAQGARALAEFERRFGAEIDRAFSRVGCTGALAADVAQQLRERLFLGGGRRPEIEGYAGRGELRFWVRAAAAHAALSALRRQRREAPREEQAREDQILFDLALPQLDPEHQHMKAVYRDEWQAAFKEALGSLSEQLRLLLRQHLIDGLSIDTLAGLYGIHRATAARRIERARLTLLSRTRKTLMARLNVDRAQLDSIMRLIQSQLEISLNS